MEQATTCFGQERAAEKFELLRAHKEVVDKLRNQVTQLKASSASQAEQLQEAANHLAGGRMGLAGSVGWIAVCGRL